jgi:hypothetical protein
LNDTAWPVLVTRAKPATFHIVRTSFRLQETGLATGEGPPMEMGITPGLNRTAPGFPLYIELQTTFTIKSQIISQTGKRLRKNMRVCTAGNPKNPRQSASIRGENLLFRLFAPHMADGIFALAFHLVHDSICFLHHHLGVFRGNIVGHHAHTEGDVRMFFLHG